MTRPADWIAPGPQPAWRADLPAPRLGEDLCYLSGDWRIFQRLDGHRWSLDDLVTAWVATRAMADRPPRRAADLGCGIGAVLMMVAWHFPSAAMVGVEAQDLSLDLARRSIEWNGIADRCQLRLGDLRDPNALPETASFDLVTATPPYFPRGSARESQRPQWAACHFEHRGGVEDYCRAAAALLAPAGRFVTCAGGLQTTRVERGAAATGLRILHRLEVIPRRGKSPLFAVYVVADGRGEAPPASEDVLVVRDAAGRWTESFGVVRAEMGLPPRP